VYRCNVLDTMKNEKQSVFSGNKLDGWTSVAAEKHEDVKRLVSAKQIGRRRHVGEVGN
jgi:hypothetical protein